MLAFAQDVFALMHDLADLVHSRNDFFVYHEESKSQSNPSKFKISDLDRDKVSNRTQDSQRDDMLAFAQDVFALMHDLADLVHSRNDFFVYHFQCVYLTR
jgi:hypothetical protein